MMACASFWRERDFKFPLHHLPSDLTSARPPTAADQGSRPAHLEDIFRLSGPLLLHEIMDWAAPFYRKPNDLIGETAYGWAGVYNLGRDNPAVARNNADSYEILAIALHSDQYDWSTRYARDSNAMDIDLRKLK
ncbi:hypothetical protein BKA65DRAFT_600304 [Rhexocercosporidium sp. MPI-PUGE-AT-0058]|nr:hypothetical protein BKA65DRAFT_600304 [Rhexocercosporidium sp. MPI-PUGE-AT-0058]